MVIKDLKVSCDARELEKSEFLSILSKDTPSRTSKSLYTAELDHGPTSPTLNAPT
ncbi:hypothetical protein LR48_Vigan07g146100 [Vigna angularis]|uniref:Uncharacterized protein n=1 Tax=Phaseolus angularis TaxID=3914 RepID=A0A0L9UYU1_PHAAN|nr:hypothetical protein LR48_Vigan07g146100 [Vigna angularis]